MDVRAPLILTVVIVTLMPANFAWAVTTTDHCAKFILPTEVGSPLSSWVAKKTDALDAREFAMNTFAKVKAIAATSLDEQKTLLEIYFASPDFNEVLKKNSAYRDQTYRSLSLRQYSATDHVLQRLLSNVLERIEEIRPVGKR